MSTCGPSLLSSRALGGRGLVHTTREQLASETGSQHAPKQSRVDRWRFDPRGPSPLCPAAPPIQPIQSVVPPTAYVRHRGQQRNHASRKQGWRFGACSAIAAADRAAGNAAQRARPAVRRACTQRAPAHIVSSMMALQHGGRQGEAVLSGAGHGLECGGSSPASWAQEVISKAAR